MSMHRLFIALTVALSALLTTSNSLFAEDLISLSQAEVNNLYRTKSRGIVGVHDPSVVHASGKT
ncbi:MAG: hypothetical protein K6C30_00170, partial [Bacteroidaceae bacterium]|nr:hypothetical protein [Bacteroidaceae bacterium]